MVDERLERVARVLAQHDELDFHLVAEAVIAELAGEIADSERYKVCRDIVKIRCGPDSWLRTGDDLDEACDNAIDEARG